MKTEFPYHAWVLQPSFKPVEVTIVGRNWWGYLETADGKSYQPSKVYPTKADARLIAAAPDLRRALESLVLFTKPTKTNAAALNFAHQVLADIEGEQS